MFANSIPLRNTFVFGLMLAFCGGCGSADPAATLADANRENIQRLTNMYLEYQKRNEWRGPKNEEVFKEFLVSFDPARLERLGIDPKGIDQLFVSDRDGEPFKIRYGVRGSYRGSDEPVLFESVGVGGKRKIAFLNMEQREADADEYDELLANGVGG